MGGYVSPGRGALAATGAGALTIGGITFESFGLVVASLALVALGAIAVRIGFRRNKGVGQG
jgi:hypothetical protein